MPDELFCERLKRVRFALGMSRTSFAALLGITRDALIHWEQGANFPRFLELPRLYNCISAHMKLSAEWFLLGLGSAPDLPPHSPIHRAIRRNNGSPTENDLGQNFTKSFRT